LKMSTFKEWKSTSTLKRPLRCSDVLSVKRNAARLRFVSEYNREKGTVRSDLGANVPPEDVRGFGREDNWVRESQAVDFIR